MICLHPGTNSRESTIILVDIHNNWFLRFNGMSVSLVVGPPLWFSTRQPHVRLVRNHASRSLPGSHTYIPSSILYLTREQPCTCITPFDLGTERAINITTGRQFLCDMSAERTHIFRLKRHRKALRTLPDTALSADDKTGMRRNSSVVLKEV